MGAFVDIVPLFGYHKVSYIIVVSIVGALAYLVLALVQFSAPTAAIAAALGFIVTFQVAFVDLLAEGKYAELMRRHPHTGGDLVSFVVWLCFIGTFAGSLISGPVADHVNPRHIFLICAPLAALVLVPVCSGWFPDPRLPPDRRGVRVDKLRDHAAVLQLSAALTLSAMLIGYATVSYSGVVQASLFVLNACALLGAAFVLLPPRMSKALLYFFLIGFLQLKVTGASDYWFTAGPECVPRGPHMSYTFYNTVGPLVSSLAGAAGMAVFQRFFTSARFWPTFALFSLLKVVGSLTDVVLFSRLNLRLGIPDRLLFLAGDAVMEHLAEQLEFMPAFILTAKLCPPGTEATVSAIMVSFINLGREGARVAGVGLIERVGIRTTMPCNFDNLPVATLLGSVVLPLFSLPLIPWLIPDARMTDELVEHRDEWRERQPLI